MAEEAKKDTTEKSEKKPEEKKPTEDGKKDETVGEIINDKKQVEKKQEGETVGLDKFLDLKKDNKKLQKDLDDLKASIDKGASAEDIADDIDAIGEKFNVDKKFLAEVMKAADARAEKRAADKFKPIEEQNRVEKLDKAFKTHFDKAMEKMPEYKNVVNADVIKTLTLDPKNADKTFSQIIEEAYGHAIGGKKTIETTKPGGGKEPESVDFDRASKDGEYFKEIMANPDLKKKYNAGLQDRIGKTL